MAPSFLCVGCGDGIKDPGDRTESVRRRALRDELEAHPGLHGGRKLITAFAMLRNKRDKNPPKKHGNIPL